MGWRSTSTERRSILAPPGKPETPLLALLQILAERVGTAKACKLWVEQAAPPTRIQEIARSSTIQIARMTIDFEKSPGGAAELQAFVGKWSPNSHASLVVAEPFIDDDSWNLRCVRQRTVSRPDAYAQHWAVRKTGAFRANWLRRKLDGRDWPSSTRSTRSLLGGQIRLRLGQGAMKPAT